MKTKEEEEEEEQEEALGIPIVHAFNSLLRGGIRVLHGTKVQNVFWLVQITSAYKEIF